MEKQKQPQFKSNVELTPGSQSVMSLLGITPERCEELCTHVEEVARLHPEWDLTQVIKEALQHAASPNEEVFMISMFEKHQGFMQGVEVGHISGKLETIFGAMDATKAYSWRGSPNPKKKEKERSTL